MARLLCFLTCFQFIAGSAQLNHNDFSLARPDSLSNLEKLDLWATYYAIHRFRSSGNIPFVDAGGKKTGLYGDTCDFCTAALEGTAFITDSAGNIFVLNFEKTAEQSFADCRKCKKFAGSTVAVENWGKAQWTISSGYGRGVRDYKLVPYRTIAVDPAFIPYGTVLFIPELDGLLIELPNGDTIRHDGYLFAGDAGGAIKNNHVDFFAGVFSGNPFPGLVFSDPKKTFAAYLVRDRVIIRSLLDLHTR